MSQTNNATVSTALARQLPALVISRSGAKLDPRQDVWEWTDGPAKRRIDFTHYYGIGYERHVLSLKQSLIPFFRGHSSAHVINLELAFRYFIQLSSPPLDRDISPTDMSNFAAKLRPTEAWRVATLNGLIQKWVAMSLQGVSEECASYLSERRKPGNIKGAAVTTRDPEIGPFTEGEVKSLYGAVNAAYGVGALGLWGVLLCRLLFACGGRISQYASLKLSDFDPETSVLSLPQAKTRLAHSRTQFLAFDISPQTSQLLAEHCRRLRDDGFGDDAAMFPETLVMAHGARKELRAIGDLFFGHCDPQVLSRRFKQEVGPFAPSTARLGGAALPVAPQRFRYTFGTRMVEEGASQVETANRLGHADLQNVGVYYSASPKVIENIDKAMGPLLAPIAQAFQGQLVEDEANSTQKGAPGSRIIDFRVSAKPVGGCAQCGKGCAFKRPVACYTCFRFEPFLDAPHGEVRDQLLKEREEFSSDPRMASVNDEAIRAVEEVMTLCAEVLRQRSGGSAE